MANGGIATDDHGNVVVDAYGRTSSQGVWALGDINGRHQLKHMANGEAKAVRRNLLHPGELRAFDQRPAPHAVFTNPQIGAVGLTEQQAKATGQPYCSIVHPYGDAAYGWAMEDTDGFCKLIGDPRTRQVIGAHIIGHEASILVQLLVQGMHLGLTADQIGHRAGVDPPCTQRSGGAGAAEADGRVRRLTAGGSHPLLTFRRLALYLRGA